jgi:transposase
MPIIRATKCTLKFATRSKRDMLRRVLDAYACVVNQFIARFWNDLPAKKDLNSTVYSQVDTWLSPTLCQIAAREAVDMIRAARQRDGDAALLPVHKGKKAQLTQQVVKIGEAATQEFDLWVTLSAVAADRSIRLHLPVKKHRHWLRLERKGYRRLNGSILTQDTIQFSFVKEAEPLPQEGVALGVDTGINVLCSLSDGSQMGQEIKARIKRAKRCQWGSQGHKRALRALKQYICETAKQLFASRDFDVLVVEALSNLNHRTKQTRRLCKPVRRSIGVWNWRLWLKRLEQLAAENCVRLWRVSPQYTSQQCRACGHTSRGNPTR